MKADWVCNFPTSEKITVRCSVNGDTLSKFSISATPQAPHGDGGVMFSFGLNQFSNLCSPLTALPRLRMTREARRTRLRPEWPGILTTESVMTSACWVCPLWETESPTSHNCLSLNVWVPVGNVWVGAVPLSPLSILLTTVWARHPVR